jgi:hypothetical protein
MTDGQGVGHVIRWMATVLISCKLRITGHHARAVYRTTPFCRPGVSDAVRGDLDHLQRRNAKPSSAGPNIRPVFQVPDLVFFGEGTQRVTPYLLNGE